MANNNVLWEKHRMYLPQMREKAVHRCRQCRFFVGVKGKFETRTACVAGIKAYNRPGKRVPAVIPITEIIRLVGLEGLAACLDCNPEAQACGRFVLQPAKQRDK